MTTTAAAPEDRLLEPVSAAGGSGPASGFPPGSASRPGAGRGPGSGSGPGPAAEAGPAAGPEPESEPGPEAGPAPEPEADPEPGSAQPLSCLDTFSASSDHDGSGVFRGVLSLGPPETLDAAEAGTVLERLAALASWAMAQQARVVHRMEALIAEEVEGSLQKSDEALAMSLTAAEAGAVLNIPHMSAMQLVSDSGQLCTVRTATLAALSHGHISHRHARVVLDQLQEIPQAQVPDFEAELLSLARGRTCAQFNRASRRLRERRWPETVPARHRSALDLRRVSFQPVADGMGEFCARIAVEKGQAIFTALTLAAHGERRAGDPRTVDQLRADIFTSLMLHSSFRPAPSDSVPGTEGASGPVSGAGPAEGPVSGAGPVAGAGEAAGPVSGAGAAPVPVPVPGAGSEPGPEPGAGLASTPVSETCQGGSSPASPVAKPEPTPDRGPASVPEPTPDRGPASVLEPTPDLGSASVPEPEPVPGSPPGLEPEPVPVPEWDDADGIKAEIMVLISADTLFGLDDKPAELNGVGPISAEAGRRLARQALHWTGLVQDPSTGEILSVGRRRKIPAGLKRWLQARDGTCRFPGCGVGTARAEIDHTRPWASGGPTEHGNLANLCPKHHRYKSLGFWRVRQKEPGFLEWVSPLGRVYRTAPQLHYGSDTADGRSADSQGVPSVPDPPPF